MKVILLRDVPDVGRKWDIKEVKAGYGRNYLLAQNLAVLATPKSLKTVKARQEQDTQNKALEDNLLEKTLDSLKKSVFVIEKKANEKGHLFDGVDMKEISALLGKKLKIVIPVEYIKLEKPIKEIGKHKITVAKGDHEAVFEIEIKATEK